MGSEVGIEYLGNVGVVITIRSINFDNHVI